MHLKATLFHKPNAFQFTQAFLFCPQTPPYSTNQKLSIWTSPSVLFSKARLFCAKSFLFAQTFLHCHPKQPFSTTNTANSHPAITYCPPKNSVVLLISALTPYAVTPEPRTDSKPFRRRFVRKAGFGLCCRKALLKSSPAELWIEVAGRSPVCFLVTFCTTQKVTIRSLAGSSEVLRTSNQPTKTTTFH